LSKKVQHKTTAIWVSHYLTTLNGFVEEQHYAYENHGPVFAKSLCPQNSITEEVNKQSQTNISKYRVSCHILQ